MRMSLRLGPLSCEGDWMGLDGRCLQVCSVVGRGNVFFFIFFYRVLVAPRDIG